MTTNNIYAHTHKKEYTCAINDNNIYPHKKKNIHMLYKKQQYVRGKKNLIILLPTYNFTHTPPTAPIHLLLPPAHTHTHTHTHAHARAHTHTHTHLSLIHI